MLPGMEGRLVTGFFLERCIETQQGNHPIARRSFVEWRAQCAGLGPASSTRAILEVGAEPLIRHLGFNGLTRPATQAGLVVTAATSRFGSLALVVASWGERLDPFWRIG